MVDTWKVQLGLFLKYKIMDNIKLIHNFKGHSDKAWNVAWNHKGKLLASCGSDKVIHIWDKEGYITNTFWIIL